MVYNFSCAGIIIFKIPYGVFNFYTIYNNILFFRLFFGVPFQKCTLQDVQTLNNNKITYSIILSLDKILYVFCIFSWYKSWFCGHLLTLINLNFIISGELTHTVITLLDVNDTFIFVDDYEVRFDPYCRVWDKEIDFLKTRGVVYKSLVWTYIQHSLGWVFHLKTWRAWALIYLLYFWYCSIYLTWKLQNTVKIIVSFVVCVVVT